MPSVPHFLLTRFNVRVAFAPEGTGLQPGWLERRVELFERYCLPSVLAQSSADFQWLILMDEATPLRFRDKMTALSAGGRFEAIYLGPDWIQGLRDELRSRMSSGIGSLITTRLDSDDAICATFMEGVRRAAGAPGVLAYPRGLILSSLDVFLHDYPANPFVSLVEASEHVRTVFTSDHDRLREHYPIRYISETPAWLQVVHGGNSKNSVKGLWRGTARRLPDWGFQVRLGPEERFWPSLGSLGRFLRSLMWWQDVLGPGRRAFRAAFGMKP